MSGVLYIVATPIGNLDDITLRAKQTLGLVDIIAAEDTRHSQRLLNHLGINNKMISLHEHNEHQRIQQILNYLQQGNSIALISDAGTPLISDPGYPLVRAVIEQGFSVRPIPGVSSIIAALSAAGLPTDQFCFHGFLSHKNSERLDKLKAISNQSGTHILLESTHRIQRLLEQLDETLTDVAVVLAKELTKRYETFIRGTARQCLQAFNNDKAMLKGEFVVLLHINRDAKTDRPDIDTDSLLRRLMQDLSLKKAVRLAVEISGLKKNELYQQALKINNDN